MPSLLRCAFAVMLVSGCWSIVGAQESGAAERPTLWTEVQQRQLADYQPPIALAPQHDTPCVGGLAGTYPCEKVTLQSFLPLATIGGGNGNDVWGWTDPTTGKEYALMGRTNGTAFVDVTDPQHPVYLGNLPTHTSNSTWRDIKVYADHAFIVSEATDHGMQVLDLDALRTVVTPPVTFTATAHYNRFGRAHNIAINEETGFAYAIGSVQGTTTCNGGLHMVNIQTPDAPTFAGCFSADGYTHDTQCVVYTGPDTVHQGKEICFNSNEDTLTIVDVTNKAAPVQLSRVPYTGSGYTHQGWLSEDQTRFFIDDELDESNFGHNTKTWVWNVENLDAPSVINFFLSPTPAIDHNQYVKGNYIYQANYRSGLRILRIDNLATGQLSQFGYFDIYPADNNTNFNGAWSTYPYFPSGNVVVSGIEQGLFVVRPQLCAPPASPTGAQAVVGGDNRIDLSWQAGGAGVTYRVRRSYGSCPGGSFEEIATGLTTPSFSDTSVSGSLPYSYQVVAVDPTGECVSVASACVDATATGACTAPPAFTGVAAVTDRGEAACRIELSWASASPRCGGGVSYNVYRSTDESFLPAPANRIASAVPAGTYSDTSVVFGSPYHYIVRAVDGSNGAEDTNLVRLSSSPTGPIADGTFATGAEVGEPSLVVGTGAPQHLGWQLSTARKRSGQRSFFSSYGSSYCAFSRTAAISLTPLEAPQLSFWTVYAVESGFDGGVVEISANGGGSWTRLPLSPNYPSVFTETGNQCGYPLNAPAFSGTNLGWIQHTADLSAWAGQTVQLRFRISTDGAVQEEGWYLDDLSVSHVQVPGQCSSGIFADGFESGDAAGWSSVVP
jgi:choice-of-anchor B domain-containing protein